MDTHRITESLYAGDAGAEYQASRHAATPRTYALVAAARARKLQPLVRGDDRVLEFGVGCGWNLARLRCAGKTGFDVAASVAEQVSGQGIRFVDHLGATAAGGFDAVICHHVLEHVPDPFAVLRQLRDVLAPGGRLLLFVPCEGGRRSRRFERGEPNHHLYAWTVQTLGNLVEQAGLRVAAAGTGPFGYDRFVARLAERLHAGERTFRALIAAVRLIRPLREVRIVAERDR